jgi:hypothetical protein
MALSCLQREDQAECEESTSRIFTHTLSLTVFLKCECEDIVSLMLGEDEVIALNVSAEATKYPQIPVQV